MKRVILALLIVTLVASLANAAGSDMSGYLEKYSISSGPLWSIFLAIFKLCCAYISKAYGVLMDYFKYPFRIILLAYIFYVAKCVASDGYKKLKSLVYSCLYITFMYSVIFEWNFYQENIVKTTMFLGLDLSSFFVSIGDLDSYTKAFDVFTALDGMALKFFDAIQEAAPKGSIITEAGRYISYAIAAIPLYLVFICMYLSFFVIFTMSFYSMFVLFLLGGPILLLAAFQETRHILWVWLRGIANYLFMAMFVSIVMGITLMGLISSIEVFGKNALMGMDFLQLEYLKILIWCGFSLVMILKSPDFAAHMSGSMAGSTAGITGGLSAVSSIFASSMLTVGKRGMSNGFGALGKAGAGVKGYVGNPTELLRKMRGARD